MNRFSMLLIPDLIIDSVYDLPSKYLRKKGIKAIIFDIDNTLVPYDQPQPDEKLAKYLFSLRERGIRIALVSNNSAERVALFNAPLGFFAIADARKPRKNAIAPALAEFSGIKKKNILFVGDQLLTDVLTARKNQIRVITVKPIKKKESLFFFCKRQIEKPLIRKYYHTKKIQKVRADSHDPS